MLADLANSLCQSSSFSCTTSIRACQSFVSLSLQTSRFKSTFRHIYTRSHLHIIIIILMGNLFFFFFFVFISFSHRFSSQNILIIMYSNGNGNGRLFYVFNVNLNLAGNLKSLHVNCNVYKLM